MPRSRKRNRKASPLVRAKNVVRGSKEPTIALTRALASAVDADKEKLVRWAEGMRFSRRGPMGTAFPKIPLDISQLPEEIKSTYAEELGVLVARVLLHNLQITFFVRERRAIETALLNSRLDECETRLDSVESALGSSIWLTKMRLTVTALKSGLEAQKRFAEELIESRGRSPLSTVVRFTSQRNEESTSVARFVLRLKNAMDRAGLSDATKTHYTYHLIYDAPTDDRRGQWLLLHESQVSLIDAYEAFVSLTVARAAASQRLPAGGELAALDALTAIDDPRNIKLRFIAGSTDDSQLLTRNLKMDEALLNGTTLGAATISASAVAGDARNALVEAMLRVRDQTIPEVRRTVRDEMVADMCLMLADPACADDALASISKRAMNTDPSVTSFSYLDWATDALSDEPPYSKVRQYRACLSSPYLDPWDLPFLPRDAKQLYLAALYARYGENIVVRFMSWLAGTGDEPRHHEISHELRTFGRAFRAYEGKDFEAVTHLATALEDSNLFRTSAIRWQCNALLALEKRRDVIAYTANLLAESPAYYSIVPVSRVFEGKRWKDLRAFADEIGLAVLLDLFFRRTGQSEAGSFRRYAAEDFMHSRKVTRPSQLELNTASVPKATLIYFLSDVCVPEVLDLMTTFPSSRTVQEERRAVCARLTELSPENSVRYRDEITTITASLKLDEGVRLLDQSRVFVDRDGVLRWAEQELKESFDRYRALHHARVGFDPKEFTIALKMFLENQEPIPDQFLAVPKGEADILLFDLITRARDNFLLSPMHGLDAFLSMRVRHGTLSGMLRGPLEQTHIINQRARSTGRYIRDPYWSSVLPTASQDTIGSIEAAIMTFSEKFDEAVDDLRGRLQIKRKDRPNGMFEVPLTSLHVHWLREALSKDARLEDFVSACIDAFWLLLDESLHAVQAHIETDFRQRVGNLFEELSSTLQRATKGVRHQLLNDSVHRARADIQSVMDSVRGWFQRLPTSKSKYPIEQAIDVAVEVVRITYRNFTPQVTKQIATDEPIVIDSLNAIGDIVFTVFDNVYKHSGVARNPNVRITVSSQSSNSLEMTIESEVGADIDRPAADARLREVEARIDRGEFKTIAVSAEGGTGFLKLKSLLDPGGRRPDALAFGFTEAGTFFVKTVAPIYRGAS